MGKPISIIIISIFIIITGVLRIFVGVLGIGFLENPDLILLISFGVDNMLFGCLSILSGILILLNKKIGFILYIVSIILLFLFYLITSGLLNTITYIFIPLILLVILIIMVNVTGYFKK